MFKMVSVLKTYIKNTTNNYHIKFVLIIRLLNTDGKFEMMKLYCFFIVCLTFIVQNTLSNPQITKRDLELAVQCDQSVCKPPACRCASTTLDEKIPVDQIPQVNGSHRHLLN